MYKLVRNGFLVNTSTRPTVVMSLRETRKARVENNLPTCTLLGTEINDIVFFVTSYTHTETRCPYLRRSLEQRSDHTGIINLSTQNPIRSTL